jgi:hypothetical protein
MGDRWMRLSTQLIVFSGVAGGVIVSIAIGEKFDAESGWMVLGSLLLIAPVIGVLLTKISEL